MNARTSKKQISKQTKKKQLLLVFHELIPFLQIFSHEELAHLEEQIHVFVFSKAQMLARDKEVIDYIGVVAEGRAVSRTRSYEIGDIIGATALLGYQQYHSQNIPAQSDGVIIALRINDFHQIDRLTIKNKIISKLMQAHVCQLIKREEIAKNLHMLQRVQEKKVTKYLNAEWTSFFTSQLDVKEKVKFSKYFAFLRVNQKEQVANSTSKPYLLYVLQGQLIAKSKPESIIIQSGSIYNIQGFIFDQVTLQNVYCLSSEAVILIIDRYVLIQLFKMETVRSVFKIVLKQLLKNNKQQQKNVQAKQVTDQVAWNIFKKYPNTEILPLSKKVETAKPHKTVNALNQNVNLAAYQSLFRDQLGAEGKLKTNQSVASNGYDKLLTLKTQSAGKEVNSTLQYDKIKKQAQLLVQKLRKSEQENKKIKLELIEYKSRTAMQQVFKQINKLYQEDDSLRSKMPKSNALQNGQNLVSLKAAFDKQLKQNKLQMLVAKCAFKWLFITRKRKTSKKQ